MDFLRRQYGFLRPGLILAAAALTAASAPAAGQDSAPASRPVPQLVGGKETRLVPKGEPSGMWQGLAQTAGALVVVGGSMLALRALLRARRQVGPGGGQGVPAVLARTSLSTRHHIYVVRWSGRLLLVGTGPQGISVLSDTEAPVSAPSQTGSQEGQAKA